MADAILDNGRPSRQADATPAATWNAERLREKDVEPRLRLHPLGELPLRSSRVAAALHARLGGENEAACDNLTSVDTLVCAKPLEARGGAVLALRWRGPSRARSGPGF
jgi:hypothetical protein